MGKIIGVHTQTIPNFFRRPLEITYVLSQGDIGDYACYMGIGSNEFVVREGTKLSFEEAKAKFPQIEADHYRGRGGYQDGTVQRFDTEAKEQPKPHRRPDGKFAKKADTVDDGGGQGAGEDRGPDAEATALSESEGDS